MSDTSSDSQNTAPSQNGDNVTTRSKKKARRCTLLAEEVPSKPTKCNMKVPTFSPEDPEIWFALLEAQFENYRIEDDATKFNQVIINLDLVHAKAVKDLITNPPVQGRYIKIKTELIRRLSASHERKVKQLLTHEELGDRKPSQFLRHLQDLAGPSVPSDFIRTIWSQRLPTSIQPLLASQPTLTLEQLADLADNIQDIVTPCNVMAASSSHNGQASEIAELKRMVERLAMKVDECTRNPYPFDNRCRSRHNTTSRNRSRSRPRSRSASEYRKHPVCWYHYKFGNKASKCIKPCDYLVNNTDSS